jgi:signal transduction histidine kinase
MYRQSKRGALKPEELGFEVQYSGHGTKRTKVEVEVVQKNNGEELTMTVIPGAVRTEIARKIIDKEFTAADVSATFGLGRSTAYHWAETLGKRVIVSTEPVMLSESSMGGRPQIFDKTAKEALTARVDSRQRKNSCVKVTNLSTQEELLKYANDTLVRNT